MTSLRWYLLGLLALFGAFVALEYYRPRPLDWRPTYLSKDKIPYGAYVLYDQLPRLLGTDSVQVVRVAAFNQLTGIAADPNAASAAEDELTSTEADRAPGEADSTRTDSARLAAPADSAARADSAAWAAPTTANAATAVATAPPDSAATDAKEVAAVDESDDSDADSAAGAAAAGPRNIPLLPARANYLFVGENCQFAPADARALLRYVAQGHAVFIAAEDFGSYHGVLPDSLGFRSTALRLAPPRLQTGGAARPAGADSTRLRFTNPQLSGPTYRLPGGGAAYRLDVAPGRAGATLATDAQGRAVLIRLDYGRGHFYLCSVPLAFTNYFVLQPRTTGFAAGALTYLPAGRPAWWDEYEKTGPPGEQSLLRVLLDHEALRAACYLALVGGLLLLAVEARRRQRIIPVIRPLPNTTLLFTRTVASLYQQGRSHGLMAEKKVSLFLDYLRTRFQETNPDFGDEAFRARLAQKAGLPRARVDELLRLVNFARTAPQVTDRELLRLSQALNDFRREASR